MRNKDSTFRVRIKVIFLAVSFESSLVGGTHRACLLLLWKPKKIYGVAVFAPTSVRVKSLEISLRWK